MRIRSTPLPRSLLPRCRAGQGRRDGDGRSRSGSPTSTPASSPIQPYKNNVDNKGASYGCHENYLMSRRAPSPTSCGTSPRSSYPGVVCGAGRVGLGQDGTPARRVPGLVVVDYFEVEVALETTLKRPIINTRDEPHADPERFPAPARHHRRRQPVRGAGLPRSARRRWCRRGRGGFLADLSVERPVTSLHEAPHDTSLKHLMTLKDYRQLTAVQLQMEYAEQARKFVENRYGSDVDAVTADVLERWSRSRADWSPIRCHLPPSWTGWRSWPCSSPTAKGMVWSGRTRNCIWWTCSTPTSAQLEGCYHGWSRWVGWSDSPRRRDRPGRARAAQRYPRLLPAVAAWRNTRRTWLPPSWDSVIFDLPGGTPCSWCRPLSRCGARKPTSANCWTAAGPLRSWGAGALRRMSHHRWTRRHCAQLKTRADAVAHPVC